ncbi:hypothetical protein GQ53DRAFT_794983 [Thozetella sp. PMI_491]|nr:hypothetical protein GQ53DRAFT_794983 [Thozetella sp. PMI_491]
MDSVHTRQDLSPTGWATVLCLLAGAIAACLLFRPTPPRSEPSAQGVRLVQVHPGEHETGADVDIIAIHGLDTKSPDTWIWVDPGDPTRRVHWLRDPDMLPAVSGRARIFTCDWPADLFEKSSRIAMTVEELARSFLAALQAERRRTGVDENRPILFVASCLGGIVLIQALVLAAGPENEYTALWRATGGIVFLATPFRGTAFQDNADIAVFLVQGYAAWTGRIVSELLGTVKDSTPFLQDLVANFTAIWKDHSRLAIFYEKEKGNLFRKVIPCRLLADLLKTPKLLVDESSARLDIVQHPISLQRTHVLMNKFQGPEDLKPVAGQIARILGEIRKGSLLKRADAWIRDTAYTPQRLKIERLSGEELSMDKCYINLAFVEQSGKDAGLSDASDAASDAGDATHQSSPFSLLARQKVETPDENMQVELPSLFEPREASNGDMTHPRRILIRGRAGVGKTTLCKKIVHDFHCDAWSAWRELFDRVLWVPLRNLKRKERQAAAYNFEDLFYYEYFSGKGRDDGGRLVKELRQILETKSSKTLFLLDGLDELSQDGSGESGMARFLADLLNQPNVIITSRPHASLPSIHFDLEVETIGFYLEQVGDYIRMAFTDCDTDVLDQGTVYKSLMRIPIQLDALCFAWERGFKKDITFPRLEKKPEDYVRNTRRPEIQRTIRDEATLLGCLAFSGLSSDVINFTPDHRDNISEQFDLLESDLKFGLDGTLANLSFLRTSDPSLERRSRNYHFLHLTFQEYFAARYFVQQWKAKEPLEYLDLNEPARERQSIDPATFLARHKYTAHYDILWRFVAGLLDAEGRAEEFFNAIERQPRDLLGPTHQRLVMHCLSEVSTEMSNRKSLEWKLSQWLLFECSFRRSARLAREAEFPEQALYDALQVCSDDVKKVILRWLQGRPTIPSSIIELAASWLKHENVGVRRAATDALQGQSSLPEAVLTAIAARLEDRDRYVRQAAADALQGQSNLPEAVVTAIAARLEHEDRYVRRAAADALQGQSNLPEAVVTAIAGRLDHEDRYVRRAAADALQSQSSLPEAVVTAIAARLEDKDPDVRQAAADALQGQSNLPEAVLTAIAARLEHKEWYVRRAAADALQGQSNLPEAVVTAIAGRLEDQDWYVRLAAAAALRGQSNLLEAVVTAIAGRLEHKEWYVRQAAADAFRGQSNLPEAIVTAIAGRLEDEDRDVREAATDALRSQSNLPEAALTAIASRLEDEDRYVRRAAADALRDQSNLPEAVLTAIAARLEHNNREAATDALRGQSNLPEAVLTAIAARLEHDNRGVRRAAADALRGQSNLPEAVLTAIAARLEDKDRDVREAAINALRSQSNLPEAAVTAIAARLEDEDRDAVLTKIVARLEDKDPDVSNILRGQSNLPEAVLMEIAARLEDEDRKVRHLAEFTLRSHRAFYSTLHRGPSVESLYEVLLWRSFEEQWSWYVENQTSLVNMPGGVRRAGIENMQEFVDMVNKAQPPGIPSTQMMA